MSYNDYTKAVELINKNKHLVDFEFYPQEVGNISNIEKILNVELPKSYKNFLKSYGKLAFSGSYIEGIDDGLDNDSNIVSKTLEERNVSVDPSFPNSFIPFYDLGNGEKFCLDTSKMNSEGECPLMAWYFGRIESIKDDVGEDFGDFLLNFVVKPSLISAEEEGDKVNW